MHEVFKDNNRHFYILMKRGHKFYHLLTTAGGEVGIIKMGIDFFESLIPATNPNETAKHAAETWRESYLPKSPAGLRAIHLIITGNEMPTPEEEVAIPEVEKLPTSIPLGTTLRTVCLELEIDPTLARKFLRSKPELGEEGGRWTWSDYKLLAKVKSALRKEFK